MKNTFSRLAIGFLFIAAIDSCSKSTEHNSFDSWIEDGHISITAKGGDRQSKTILQSNGDVFWSPNDSISVFYGSYNLGRFTGLNTEPTNTTVFRSDDTFAFGTISGGKAMQFWGVNPYSADNESDGKSLTFTVPAQQNAVVGTFAPGSFPSIGHSDNLELAFYNVCGGLKFKIVNSGVTQITFKGNNNETIAGKVMAVFDDNECPKITQYLNKETEVHLICKEGFIPGEWYYISLLPTTLKNGFTIELSNGIKTISYVSDLETEIKRSVFGVLSDVDEGLEFEADWRTSDFIHKSLLLTIPNCAFSSFFVSEEGELISEAMKKTSGNMEFIQMFANGPAPTDGIMSLTNMMHIYSVPFEITDYREKVDDTTTPYSTYLSTPKIYGTATGVGIKSYYNGNELNIETSMYFKKADKYKVVVALVQDDTSYPFTYNSGANSSNMRADGVARHILTDILGDDIDVVSDNIILYRSYKKVISNEDEKKNLRVLVYLLKPYGNNVVYSNGDFGSYYVDNAFSVLAGHEAELPMVININSVIVDFDYGGTIEF